jgi:glycosyltransferase involved in cell wall biosynthesis
MEKQSVPQVDVIIPVYNTPVGYVREALESVQAQTLQDWRVVLVNDGSRPDYTVQLEALLDGLADPRIRYVKSENRGLPGARNLGIASSDSPLVAFLDSDDLWYPDKLQVQADLMRERPDVDLVHACSDLLHGDDHANLERVPPDDRGLDRLSQREACLRMLRGNFVGVNTVMVRRASGEGIGFFDASFRSLEDKEMWSRWLISGRRFLHLPRVLAVYRVHATNMSKNALHMRRGRLDLVRKVDTLVPGAPAWLGEAWPKLRREMLAHANQETAETFLEAHDPGQALRYAVPWRSGVSVHTARLFAASLAGLLGWRRGA